MVGKMRKCKILPSDAIQHKTAGPYSPVLSIEGKRLVVISGQAPVDMDGNVVGTTIEDQTRATLINCKNQLSKSGCSLNDVFKVNVFMKDLSLWDRFNKVYREYFDEPLPVRTVVGVQLLSSFSIEIEMWAVIDS